MGDGPNNMPSNFKSTSLSLDLPRDRIESLYSLWEEDCASLDFVLDTDLDRACEGLNLASLDLVLDIDLDRDLTLEDLDLECDLALEDFDLEPDLALEDLDLEPDLALDLETDLRCDLERDLTEVELELFCGSLTG